jgi:hypothetical protein
MSLIPLLFLLFLGLKLGGVIAWSWVWVFAPLWIPAALWAAFTLAGLLIALIVCLVKREASRRRPVVTNNYFA